MKPAPERSYQLEDAIGDIRRELARHVFDGVTYSAEDVRNLVESLEICRQEAIALRNELSRKRWSGRAETDPLVDVVLAEAKRPQTNLVFFPVAARPIPGDAPQLWPPKGGAA